MNLHGIAGPIIAVVNPTTAMTILVSTGSVTSADGTPVPQYADPVYVDGQVQALSYRDLAQVDGLNLNGTKRAIYLSGRYDGVVRPLLKGGDLVNVLSGVHTGAWLVVQVLEQWPDWCKVAVTLQNEPAS